MTSRDPFVVELASRPLVEELAHKKPCGPQGGGRRPSGRTAAADPRPAPLCSRRWAIRKLGPPAAAGALGPVAAADPETRAALLKALGDPEWWVRRAAAAALGRSAAADPDPRRSAQGCWAIRKKASAGRRPRPSGRRRQPIPRPAPLCSRRWAIRIWVRYGRPRPSGRRRQPIPRPAPLCSRRWAIRRRGPQGGCRGPRAGRI